MTAVAISGLADSRSRAIAKSPATVLGLVPITPTVSGPRTSELVTNQRQRQQEPQRTFDVIILFDRFAFNLRVVVVGVSMSGVGWSRVPERAAR